MLKKGKLCLAAACLVASQGAMAAAPQNTGLAGLDSLLGGGGLSINTVPVIGGLLGAPGSQSVSLYSIPVISTVLESTTGVLPPLGGLPAVGGLPFIGPLVSSNGSVTLQSLPGIGTLLFVGGGENLLTLTKLPLLSAIYSGNPANLGALPGILSNPMTLIPFDGGVLGI